MGGSTCTSPGQPAQVFPPGFLCCSAAHQSPATKAGECQHCLGCRESSQSQVGGYTELREAQGGAAGAVQGAESRASPQVHPGGVWGSTRTCGAAPAMPWALPTLPLCFRGLGSFWRTCSEEAVGPTRAEGTCVHV